jgi:ABC-2 type transport system permease protein
MTQITAGLRKEWLFFWRSFRFGGIVIAFIACALLAPLTSAMMLSMSGVYEEMGMGGMAETIAMYEGESGLFLSFGGTIGMFSSAFVPPMMFLVVALFIGGMAGGEQKRRSIIIPQTAGLKPLGYVLPKFILFPPLMLVMTVLAMLVCNLACEIIIGRSFPIEVVLMTGTLSGLSLMFLVCMYMFFGISLAQPRLAILYVGAANAVFPIINMVFDLDRFTPWSLEIMIGSILHNYLYSESGNLYEGMSTVGIVATVAITFALCVVFMLLTHFSLVAKQMDNTADEVY